MPASATSSGAEALMRATFSTPFCSDSTTVPAGQQAASSRAADAVAPPLTHSSTTVRPVLGVAAAAGSDAQAAAKLLAKCSCGGARCVLKPSRSEMVRPSRAIASVRRGRPTRVTVCPAAASRPPT